MVGTVLGLLFLFVVVPVVWGFMEYEPSPPPAPDPERVAVVRHEQARQNILTIEQATTQLLAATTAELAREMVVAAMPPEPAYSPAVVDGFIWTPDGEASISTSGASMTYYMPLGRRS